jgi:serine/threonine protein kinase
VPRPDPGLTRFPDHIRELIEQVRGGFARQRYFSNAMNKLGVCYSASYNSVSLLTMYAWSAVDMWSAGMILLFFLTGKFPLFQSNDDVEALLEIACIIGRRRMEKAATLHCERLLEARGVPYINSVLQPGRSPRIFHRLQQKGNPGANS